MIQTKNLSFSYTRNSVIHFPTITIDKGEHCLLLGNSGSGKTTLLHMLGGLLRNFSGEVTIMGQDIASLSESSLDRFRGNNVGFIFQRNHLVSALSVEENLLLAPYLAGIKVEETRITNVLQQLDISDKRKSSVTQISQGQAQRVAIARAVLNKPSIILADEPTSALDDKSCDQVIKLLVEVANENKSTLVIATHDQRLKEKIQKHVLLTSNI